MGDETISTFLVGFLTLSLYDAGTTQGPRKCDLSPQLLGPQPTGVQGGH